MKPLLTTLLLVLSVGAVAPAPIPAVADERDEFRQTYQLTPGARVRLSGINGRVTVVMARVGEGGPPITVSGANGTIRFTPLN